MDFLKKMFSNNEIKVLDKLDTTNHNYQIFIKNISGFQNDNIESNYFLDNQSQINKLSKKWRLPFADSVCRGGYDYSISIFKGKQVEQLILICFKCNTWSIQKSETPEKSLFEVDKEKFQLFLQTYFDPIEIQDKKFRNRKEAIEFWKSELTNPKLISHHQLLPDWIRFEGEYTLSFTMNKSEQETKPNKYLEQKINKFGDCGEYQFGQSMAIGNNESNTYFFSMKSSRKLFSKFDESEPEMLVKNNPKSKSFFNKDWKEFNDYSLRLYYRK